MEYSSTIPHGVKIAIGGIDDNMGYLSTISPGVKITIGSILDNTDHLSIILSHEFSHGREQHLIPNIISK